MADSALDNQPSPASKAKPVVDAITPILRVADASASAKWYEKLGFVKEWEHRFEPTFPAFVSVLHGQLRLFLSEHTGDARPDTLLYIHVKDIEVVASALDVTTIEEAPWAREIEVKDPDGNRLRLGESKKSS